MAIAVLTGSYGQPRGAPASQHGRTSWWWEPPNSTPPTSSKSPPLHRCDDWGVLPASKGAGLAAVSKWTCRRGDTMSHTKRKQISGWFWAENFTRQVFVFMRHQQFFKATYWVTTTIDYINGLPLEKESNYILVQIAKCRLISNLLGSPLFFSWGQGQSCGSGESNHCEEAGNVKRLCPFTQQAGTERLASLVSSVLGAGHADASKTRSHSSWQFQDHKIQSVLEPI